MPGGLGGDSFAHRLPRAHGCPHAGPQKQDGELPAGEGEALRLPALPTFASRRQRLLLPCSGALLGDLWGSLGPGERFGARNQLSSQQHMRRLPRAEPRGRSRGSKLPRPPPCLVLGVLSTSSGEEPGSIGRPRGWGVPCIGSLRGMGRLWCTVGPGPCRCWGGHGGEHRAGAAQRSATWPPACSGQGKRGLCPLGAGFGRVGRAKPGTETSMWEPREWSRSTRCLRGWNRLRAVG